MPEIKGVLLDLDDTLVPEMAPEREALLVIGRLVAEKHEIDPESLVKSVEIACRKFWAQWSTPSVYSEIAYSGWEGLWGPSDDPEVGLGNDEETIRKYKISAWDEVLLHLGIRDVQLRDEIIDRHRTERIKRLKPFPHAVEMLSSLGDRYPLAVVTNGSPAVQRFKLEKAGLSHHIQAFVASGDVGVGKPNPLPYATALEAIGVAPVNAVMIGNSWSLDVQGAERLGIRSIWFNVDEEGRPEDGLQPFAEIDSLDQVAAVVEKLSLSN